MKCEKFGLVNLSRAGLVAGALLLALALPHCWAEETNAHPTLALGSAAPDFSLPGIDGKTHTLAEYKAAKVLVIVFTCDHCPTAQLYEVRLKKLVEDYKGQSVQFVMIQPNDPEAVRLGRAGLDRRGRRPRRHEDPRRLPALQLPLSL